MNYPREPKVQDASQLPPELRRARNAAGRRAGFGRCLVCGDTWDWKAARSVEYADGRGAFPVCTECWTKRSDAEIIAAAEELAAIWNDQAPPAMKAKILAEADQMTAAHREAVKKRRETP